MAQAVDNSAVSDMLTFSTTHDLAECIDGCGFIDDARQLLVSNPVYTQCVDYCSTAILRLCQCYCVGGALTIHALMVGKVFVATKLPDDPLFRSTGVQFVCTCVGVACFALSMQFHSGDPKLEDMLPIVGISNLATERRYYKQVLIHILTAIKWRLFFPTGCNYIIFLIFPNGLTQPLQP